MLKILSTVSLAVFATLIGTLALIAPIGLMLHNTGLASLPSAPYWCTPFIISLLATTYAFIRHRYSIWNEWPRWNTLPGSRRSYFYAGKR